MASGMSASDTAFTRAGRSTNSARPAAAKFSTAALLVPLSAWLSLRAGGWNTGFFASAVLNFAAAGLALFVLRPARVKAVSAALIPDAMGITRV